MSAVGHFGGCVLFWLVVVGGSCGSCFFLCVGFARWLVVAASVAFACRLIEAGDACYRRC